MIPSLRRSARRRLSGYTPSNLSLAISTSELTYLSFTREPAAYVTPSCTDRVQTRSDEHHIRQVSHYTYH